MSTVIEDLPSRTAPEHRKCRKCGKPFRGAMATRSGLDSGLCQYCYAAESSSPPRFDATSGGACPCDRDGRQMVAIPCGHGGSIWFYGRVEDDEK